MPILTVAPATGTACEDSDYDKTLSDTDDVSELHPKLKCPVRCLSTTQIIETNKRTRYLGCLTFIFIFLLYNFIHSC